MQATTEECSSLTSGDTQVGGLGLAPAMTSPTELVEEESVAQLLEESEDVRMNMENIHSDNLNRGDEMQEDGVDDQHGEGADEEDDEDMSSELSEGVDLQDDLLEALEDDSFAFKGTFYHSAIQTTALNPCLYISGLGLVGLPLSERDAKSIISASNLAPFGRGERTLVDKEVRDTWEIEPSRISFANPQWENYINQTVCAEVCKTLGVTIGNNPPRMELYKLLLYEKGSHFLAHQDTQKANGMFATVIILLPSAYTGGQVIVSHSSTTKTIDFSADSLHSTALLAWYTDVKHEVKPVTSGYRFALSYNLIQVSPLGIPSLPDTSDSTTQLRRVLTKWREDKYNEGQEKMACLLEHQYSAANLKEGIKALKGADLHRVTFLRPIAEELGFVVGLASLEHNVTGSADDYGGGHYYGGRSWGRRGYNYYDDEDDDDGEAPAMGEVDSTSTTISGLVNLAGDSLVSLGKIDLDDNCLVPKEPFEDQSPDDEDYEGYMGNYAGQVEHWYRRTVLVLVHEHNVDDLCFSVEGAPYAMRKLKESSNSPTSEDRYWATKVFQSGTPLRKDQLLTLMDYAFKWKDVAIWKKVASSPTWTLGTVDMEHFLQAWEIFSFEGVRVSFQEILARSTVLSERMTFLSTIRTKSPEKEKVAVTAWCKKESDKILASYSSSNAQDSASILTFMKYAGLDSFKNVMMPNLLKISNNYVLMISLIKMFEDSRNMIIEQETRLRGLDAAATTSDDTTVSSLQANANTQPDLDHIVTDLVKQCLQAAALQWSSVSVPSYYPSHHYLYNHQAANSASSAKVDRIITILDKAISLSEMNICRTLIIDILKIAGPTSDKFSQLYNPLIPRLRILLASKKLDITTPPFQDFLQVVIGIYMRDVLGKRGNLLNIKLRKIGCGCNDCKDLDKFILDPTSTTNTFRVVQARRLHLERQCANARDMCTYQTIKSGSPHAVQVTKLPEIVQASMWPYRQKSAKAFLNTIGDDAVIAKIMGSRYADVNNAISGAVPFGEANRTHALVSTAGTSTSSGSTGISQRASVQLRPPALSSGVPKGTSVPPQAGSTSNSGVPQQAFIQPQASSSPHSSRSSSIMPTGAPSSAPPEQVAGKKRKSAPSKNYIQLGPVIDLTSDDD